ncbi:MULTISPECIES: twin-arginine translocase subunit TatC [unclassified Curtobacterium]|uniref:twin-arginine translocase subunit TatC n=1 Tax=unclassified Curtobacterium TaxID=257496 RepID=UPI00034C907B|nr:twin-arginine translocase subunit TatC [Curtobacterium sp. B18]
MTAPTVTDGARRRTTGTMSLGQHLDELRRRLARAALAVAVAAVAGWFLTPAVLAGLRAPVAELATGIGGHTAELNFPAISGAFDLRLQITLTIAVVLACPVWLHQAWAFVVPALLRKERAHAVGFLGSAIPLFLGGCWFGWSVLPHVVQVLGSFVAHQDTSIVDAKAYYDFAIKLVLAVGIAFVLPVFLVLLNVVGVLSAAAIRGAWRIAVLCILVFTALVTPSADVASMFLLAVPMVVLYLAACTVAWLHDRRLERRLAAASRAVD